MAILIATIRMLFVCGLWQCVANGLIAPETLPPRYEENGVESASKDVPSYTASKAASYFGRILSATTEKPISGARIARVSSGEITVNFLQKQIDATSVTDSDGYFSCAPIEISRDYLEIDADGYARTLVATNSLHQDKNNAATIYLSPSIGAVLRV